MTLILVSLSMIYVWIFVKPYLTIIPDFVIHFGIMPALALALFLLPTGVLLISSACSLVYFMDGLIQFPQRRAKAPKSNIPAPPKGSLTGRR